VYVTSERFAKSRHDILTYASHDGSVAPPSPLSIQ